jgi:putative methyltransferase (TIGR04325 family)
MWWKQPHYVKIGKAEFEDENLKFFFTVDDCMKEPVHCILFGGVLQYLEKPYEVLADVFKHKVQHILITRTGFTLNKPDRITIQKVPKSYYDASYPCWIFDERKFINFFDENGYELVFDYDEKWQLNISSKMKGCLFELKEK